MKKLLLLPFLALALTCSAQVLTVSEEIPINSDVAYEVLGEMGNHVLLFRDRKTEFEVQAFNRQMRQSWSKEIILDRRLPKVLGIVPTRQDFTLVYSYRQKGNTLIKAHRISVNDAHNGGRKSQTSHLHPEDRRIRVPRTGPGGRCYQSGGCMNCLANSAALSGRDRRAVTSGLETHACSQARTREKENPPGLLDGVSSFPDGPR